MAKKKILIHITNSGYANQLSREALDTTLAFSTFDQDISVFFSGSAILQLLDCQNSGAIQQKNLGKTLRAFELYDIEKVYVDADDLSSYNLDKKQLSLNIEELSKNQQKKFFAEHQLFLDY